jgi:GDP-L-fucose synthase
MERLRALDHNITGTYHSMEPRVIDSNIKYTRADLMLLKDCKRVVKGVDIVFLCAANTGGIAKTSKSSRPIIDSLQINMQLLDQCVLEGVRQVFLISSTTVYPERNTPLCEFDGFMDDPSPAYFGIGWMNRYLEKLACYYQHEFGMPITIVRPSSMYGPYDNFSEYGSHVIPSLIQRFLSSEQTIHIWGDGSQQRDFVYAGDVAELLVSLIGKEELLGPYNVGYGEPTSIRDLTHEIAHATGRTDLPIIFDTSKPIGIQSRKIDISLSKSLLGFERAYKSEITPIKSRSEHLDNVFLIDSH